MTDLQNTETTAPTLTPEDHAFFLENGYLIVKGVVSPEMIAAAVAFLEEGAFEGDVGAANYKPQQNELVNACVTDTVFAVMEELMGSEYPYPKHRGASDMPRPYASDAEWKSQEFHVDSDYPTLMPTDDVLSFFIFLTKVQSRGGAFQYAPGSPFRYFAFMSDNPENLKQHCTEPELSGPIQEYLAEPGDLLIMTHLGGHAGSNNVTDPQTRHALLNRYHPFRRLVPGLKPFAEMSSAEKVYSARYLREIKGFPIPEPPLTLDARTDAALRDGDVIPGGEIYSYISFIEKGRPGILFVGSSPGLQRAVSDDFVNWKPEIVLESFPLGVVALQDYKRDNGVTLFVGIGGDKPETQIRTGRDASHLMLEATIPGVAFGFAHYTTDYGSVKARERVIFTRPAAKPNEIRCGWGNTWADAVAHGQENLVAALPEDFIVIDAFAHPSSAGPPFALILDVREPFNKKSAAPETRPYVSVSHDVASYETPKPLAYDTETAPRQIRVYARARNYWLVTFLREAEGANAIVLGRHGLGKIARHADADQDGGGVAGSPLHCGRDLRGTSGCAPSLAIWIKRANETPPLEKICCGCCSPSAVVGRIRRAWRFTAARRLARPFCASSWARAKQAAIWRRSRN